MSRFSVEFVWMKDQEVFAITPTLFLDYGRDRYFAICWLWFGWEIRF